MSRVEENLAELPGSDLIVRGLADLADGKPTAEAALVEVARTRLSELGLEVARSTVDGREAELVLYERLGDRFIDDDPYGRYCAWLEQLVSFIAALQHRLAVRGSGAR